ncbi:chemotaxis protein CheW [Methylobacterium oryzisoli]|uniref:chemotaxis protein CheW n=1 Tax=Methylobacterium oryzisoli TaxID=3385502 RepID=UPI003892BF3D
MGHHRCGASRRWRHRGHHRLTDAPAGPRARRRPQADGKSRRQVAPGQSARRDRPLRRSTDLRWRFEPIFRLAGEEYGVPIDAVHEIVRVPEQLTRVPRTPAFIEGVVNLRGAVLPVVDQRRRFRLPDAERNDRQRIMVFLIEGVRTGFIVDSVSEVLKIPRSAIGPAPDLGQDGGAVDRIANLAEAKRIILMLNVDRLLAREEVADLRRAA